jgi:DNA-binding CsgD family transcriptional regulator
LQDGLAPAHLAEKLERARELTALSERIGDLRHLGPAAYYRAAISYIQGRPAELAAAQDDLGRVVQATGQAYYEWVQACVGFGEHFLRSDFEAASAAIARTQELGRSFGPGDETEGALGLQEFMVRRETGRLEPIRGLITGDEDTATHWTPGLLAIYCELGLREPAERVLQLLLDRELPRHQISATWPVVLGYLCEAAAWLGDRAAAERLLPLVTEYAGLNLMGGEFLGLLGSADRQLAALESLLGLPAAEAHFEAALELDTRTGSPLHVATTLAAQLVHLRRSRDHSARAAEVADEARALSVRHELVRVARLLDAVEGPRRSGALPAGLTSREVQVLQLLGNGMSNRGIAKELVISDNTAANHVRSILMKIGAANRTQAAMYASAHGLLD